jgi:hypothetical protein
MRSNAPALWRPVSSPSFVHPRVSRSVMMATSDTSSGTSTRRSSSMTTPERPGPFVGTKGRMCFCPLFARAANQAPVCSRSRNARIVGFSPLLAAKYPIPSSQQ